MTLFCQNVYLLPVMLSMIKLFTSGRWMVFCFLMHDNREPWVYFQWFPLQNSNSPKKWTFLTLFWNTFIHFPPNSKFIEFCTNSKSIILKCYTYGCGFSDECKILSQLCIMHPITEFHKDENIYLYSFRKCQCHSSLK